MNKYLTVKEYVELLEYINKNHSFREQKGRCIKYVTSHFDTRTNVIYALEFTGFFPELYKGFTSADTPENKTFKQLIYEWLEQKEESNHE